MTLYSMQILVHKSLQRLNFKLIMQNFSNIVVKVVNLIILGGVVNITKKNEAFYLAESKHK